VTWRFLVAAEMMDARKIAKQRRAALIRDAEALKRCARMMREQSAARLEADGELSAVSPELSRWAEALTAAAEAYRVGAAQFGHLAGR
jgi:hypothetical protein